MTRVAQDLERARARLDRAIVTEHAAQVRVESLERDLVIAHRAVHAAQNERAEAFAGFTKYLCAAAAAASPELRLVLCADCGAMVPEAVASWDPSGWFCASCAAKAKGGA